MKKFLVILLALALSVPAFAHAPKSLNATHRLEMVSVQVDPETKEPSKSICSATAVGPHALLTAAHCDRGVGQMILMVDDKPVVIEKRIMDGNDHEIFIVDEKFNNVAEFEREDALRKGDDVWVEGNPAGWPQLVRRGVYSGNMEIDKKIVEIYDFNGFFGDSGSAVIDEHGKIVAVVNVLLSSGNMFGTFKEMGCFPLRFTPEQLKQAQE